MIQMIKNLLGIKEKVEVRFPEKFILIELTDVAKEDGNNDDENKNINFYYIDRHGNRRVEKRPYTAERLDAIKQTYNNKIPVYDITQLSESNKFRIYSRIQPGTYKHISKE